MVYSHPRDKNSKTFNYISVLGLNLFQFHGFGFKINLDIALIFFSACEYDSASARVRARGFKIRFPFSREAQKKKIVFRAQREIFFLVFCASASEGVRKRSSAFESA